MACYDHAKGFQTPFISGKDSLYNESPIGPVTPTLLITAIGVTPDIRKTVSMELKQPGNIVYIIGKTYCELGGSSYYENKGHLGNTVPQVRIEQAKRNMDLITEAIDRGYLRACHDLSDGGLAVASAEMAFSSGYGLELDLSNVPITGDVSRNDFILFSESNSRFLVEVTKKRRQDFEALMKKTDSAEVGIVKKNPKFSISGMDGKQLIHSDLAELRRCWKSPFGGA
jgi:phosphoribosylformylglycinamidine synthase